MVAVNSCPQLIHLAVNENHGFFIKLYNLKHSFQLACSFSFFIPAYANLLEISNCKYMLIKTI